jgi:hypothetical protein
MYGDSFSQLRSSHRITDPDILAKVDELRKRRNLDVDEQVEARRQALRQRRTPIVDEDTRNKVEELRRQTSPVQADAFRQDRREGKENVHEERMKSRVDVATGNQRRRPGFPKNPPQTPPKTSRARVIPKPVEVTTEDEEEEEDLYGDQPPRREPRRMEATKSRPPSVPAIIPQTVSPIPRMPEPPTTCASRGTASSRSSNVRTPIGVYSPDHPIGKREQVSVYPKETKAEFGARGRKRILERWNKERLEERRKQSKDCEVLHDGEIWQVADVLLGNKTYPEGHKIQRVQWSDQSLQESDETAPLPSPSSSSQFIPRRPPPPVPQATLNPPTLPIYYSGPPPIPQNLPIYPPFGDIVTAPTDPNSFLPKTELASVPSQVFISMQM